MFKTVLLMVIIAFAVCEKQLNLDKFLAREADDFIVENPNGYPITVSNCLPGSPLQITNIKVKPTEVTKGKPIQLLAAGVFTQPEDTTSLHIQTLLDGKSIMESDVPHVSHCSPGPYSFFYNNNVPTFVPTGHWEVFVYLMGGDTKLACIKGTFDT